MPRRKSTSVTSNLDKYDNLLSQTILAYQDPVTNLLPPFIAKDGTPGGQYKGHAWIRDNVYCVLPIWAMSLAYRSHGEGEEGRHRANELEKNAIKLMRSLLQCMLRQVDKVENFKKTLKRENALHAKYNMSTCGSVVGDYDWGHLQIDATSLFLLVLAQMTASGLQIVYNLDEVAFIQNLVFYIESAFRTPDYGMWERGDKTNHGQTELNSTSIGMAKAALEAMSGLDLFGARGGPLSIIHVLADQVAQCNIKLSSLLPRESSSKEIDAGLLCIIGFPAFAVESCELIKEVKQQIIDKLLGKYGCRRFLRDGYHTVREDSSRLHYEPAELHIFKNIECEWPLFYIYLLINAIINGDFEEVKKYNTLLDNVIIHKEGDIETVPELYFVPWEFVNAEYHNPHSQKRKVGRKIQSMWSQSLYILCELLLEGLVNIGEIDPLNRRFSTLPRAEPTVQVVLLAESDKLRDQLKEHKIISRTLSEVVRDPECPVNVLPAKLLGEAYHLLGQNSKMNLTGRLRTTVGVLSTSMLYTLRNNVYAFYPSFLDNEAFYLCLDNELLVDLISTDIAYLKSNWRLMGCPLLILPILSTMLGDSNTYTNSPVFEVLLRIKSGYMAGVRVQLGLFKDFISTSCNVPMTFLESTNIWTKSTLVSRRSLSVLPLDLTTHRPRTYSDSNPVGGSVKRSRVTSAKKHIPMLNITLSPSMERIQVAKGWSSRRHSYESSKLLQGGMSSGASRKQHAVMATLSIQDLIHELEVATNVFDQADILHFLFDNYGKSYNITIGGKSCTVEMLLDELYDKVGFYRHWSLVRHTAGMLRKMVDNIAQVLTDLLVRQKTICIGQPNNEIHIAQPLPQHELLNEIYMACGKDHTAVAMTQEILVYLAMFIRSEPHLFHEMLRLRIGLIQNVMVTEVTRSLHCTYEDAMDQLFGLGPYQLKNLLHHVLSRKEFNIDQVLQRESSDASTVRQLSIVTTSKKTITGKLQEHVKALETGDEDEDGDKMGQWRRRRRIDGALNRVPPDFYYKVWHTLEKCEGLFIGNQLLPKDPIVYEMTAGELKFALRVETVLNSIPDPEYRQLIVEVLMVTSVLVQLNPDQHIPQVFNIDDIISTANRLFISDQQSCDGLAVKCCGYIRGSCDGYLSICNHFYDSAPSGVYGTMSYISQALLLYLEKSLTQSHSCRIS